VTYFPLSFCRSPPSRSWRHPNSTAWRASITFPSLQQHWVYSCIFIVGTKLGYPSARVLSAAARPEGRTAKQKWSTII
jgi:hypothetical protein